MAKSKYEILILPRLNEIKKLYETMNEAQIAQVMGVGYRTFKRYKTEHPELVEALKYSREHLISELKSTLKKKAKGFTYTEKKTVKDNEGLDRVETYERYSSPDLGAIHLLLKNLDPEWRNDDQTTINLKRQRLELDKEKAESNNW